MYRHNDYSQTQISGRLLQMQSLDLLGTRDGTVPILQGHLHVEEEFAQLMNTKNKCEAAQ